jgi:F-type H+-transporting ATPase subunit epsilon
MAEKSFKLEIVTPRKVVFKGDVVSFSAPGVMGGFQVLYNHAPMLAAIKIGEAKLRDPDGHEYYYAMSGGFVDVFKNHVTVLAETAERSDEIDISRAEASKTRAAERLHKPAPTINQDRAKSSLQRAMNRLRLARRG